MTYGRTVASAPLPWRAAVSVGAARPAIGGI